MNTTTFDPRENWLRIATLEGLLRRLGSLGISVDIRYDALRQNHNFTVLVGRGTVPDSIDTEDPRQFLANWYRDNVSKEHDNNLFFITYGAFGK